MRTWTLIVAAAGVAAWSTFMAWMIWNSRVPVELEFVSMEPSAMRDDSGTEPWLVTLRLTNSHDEHFQFASAPVSADAKVGNDWIHVQVNGLSLPYSLGSHTEGEFLVLMPRGTERFGLNLNYQGELFKSRFVRHLGPRGRSLVFRFPVVVSWLGGNRRWLFPPQVFRQPPHWRALRLELILPGVSHLQSEQVIGPTATWNNAAWSTDWPILSSKTWNRLDIIRYLP